MVSLDQGEGQAGWGPEAQVAVNGQGRENNRTVGIKHSMMFASHQERWSSLKFLICLPVIML